MKQALLLLHFTFYILHFAFAQNVGIGTTTPNASAMLHVDLGISATKGFLITGAYTQTSTVPGLGAGPRLMFYPGKVAFRAGYTDGTSWNDANVGSYSTAMGNSTIAKGNFSTALGSNTTASGVVSTAMGASTIASGDYSTALGYNAKATATSSTALGNEPEATGSYSMALGDNVRAAGLASTALGGHTFASGSRATAMGFNTTATASYATAMGYQSNATGSTSTAMGYQTIASGIASTAIGQNVTASGNNSTAIGYRVNTNNQTGAFIIGDSDPNNEGFAMPGIPDLFVARFWNGYYLLTSGYTNRMGVQIGHNGNAWVSICDKNLKENFEPLNGEEVLQKISKIKFSSWNYKQQDPKIYRHYGITAQDFYNAFGKDKYGTIGNDTTVNPVDMIGIDMAAIQALEKRTTNLKTEVEELKNQNAILIKELIELKEKMKK